MEAIVLAGVVTCLRQVVPDLPKPMALVAGNKRIGRNTCKT